LANPYAYKSYNNLFTVATCIDCQIAGTSLPLLRTCHKIYSNPQFAGHAQKFIGLLNSPKNNLVKSTVAKKGYQIQRSNGNVKISAITGAQLKELLKMMNNGLGSSYLTKKHGIMDGFEEV
jgi:hypothetical protein